MFVFGLAYFILAARLPRKGGIDSAAVPYFLSSLIMLLGVVHAADNCRRALREAAARRAAAASGAGPGEMAAPGAGTGRRDYKTVILTAILIAAYVALLAPFGFPLMSSIYLFLQMALLAPGRERRNYVLYAVIAVATSVSAHYVFLWAFDLMLPGGDVWYDLGWT